MENPDVLNYLKNLGEEKICVSLTLTLYFHDSLFDQRQGVLYCLEDYLTRCKDELRWYADEETGRFRRVKPEIFQLPARRLSAHDNTTPVSWIFHGGVEPASLSPFLFEAANTGDDEDLSYIRATFPADFFGEYLQNFVDMSKIWSEQVDAFHGYGGLSFNESPMENVAQADSRLVYALSMLFIGIEVDNPLLTAQCTKEAIKSVNWLTILDDSFVAKLGGEYKVSRSFSNKVTVHKYRGGIVIQAGGRPCLGDQNKGETLPEYREVASVLRPLRTKRHFPLGPEELGSFGWKGTEIWLRRFDADAEEGL